LELRGLHFLLTYRCDLECEAQEREERTYLTSEKGRRFLEEFHALQRYSEIVKAKRRGLESHLKFT